MRTRYIDTDTTLISPRPRKRHKLSPDPTDQMELDPIEILQQAEMERRRSMDSLAYQQRLREMELERQRRAIEFEVERQNAMEREFVKRRGMRGQNEASMRRRRQLNDMQSPLKNGPRVFLRARREGDDVQVCLDRRGKSINVYDMLDNQRQQEQVLKERVKQRQESFERDRQQQDILESQKTLLRERIRANIEARLMNLRGKARAAVLLPDIDPRRCSRSDVLRSLKKGLLKYHPDRCRSKDLHTQVLYEELYKELVELRGVYR